MLPEARGGCFGPLPLPDRPENQWAVQACGIGVAGGTPALSASLAADGQALGHEETALEVLNRDGVTQQQQHGQSSSERHQMTCTETGPR